MSRDNISSPKIYFRSDIVYNHDLFAEYTILNLKSYHNEFKKYMTHYGGTWFNTYYRSISYDTGFPITPYREYYPLLKTLGDYCGVFVSWEFNTIGHLQVRASGYEHNVMVFNTIWYYIHHNIETIKMRLLSIKREDNYKRRKKGRFMQGQLHLFDVSNPIKGTHARTYSSNWKLETIENIHSALIKLLADIKDYYNYDLYRGVLANIIVMNDQPKYNYKNYNKSGLAHKSLKWARCAADKIIPRRILNI